MYARNLTNIELTTADLTVKRRTRETYAMSGHRHEDYEIYYLLRGERHFFVNGAVYRLKKGDFVMIDRHARHHTMDAVERPLHEKLEIRFHPEFLEECRDFGNGAFKAFEAGSRVLHPAAEVQDYIEHQYYRMMYELYHKPEGYRDAVRLSLLELLQVASREIVQAVPARHSRLSGLHEKVPEIAQFVARHYAEEWTLSRIAEQYHFNAAYLSSKFKEVTGLSFMEHVNRARIREAQRLLTNTSDRISEICTHVGFRHLTHFDRMFKKFTGLAPSVYREIAGMDAGSASAGRSCDPD